jgi:hypothetical protein
MGHCDAQYAREGEPYFERSGNQTAERQFKGERRRTDESGKPLVCEEVEWERKKNKSNKRKQGQTTSRDRRMYGSKERINREKGKQTEREREREREREWEVILIRNNFL